MNSACHNILPLALGLLLLAGSAPAVTPPAAGVEMPAGFGAFFARQNRIYRTGLRPERSAVQGGPRLARSAPAKISLPVILASYADRAGVIKPEIFSQMLFGTLPTGTLARYYAEVSAGKFTVEGQVYGWVSAPLAQPQYNAAGPLGEGGTFPQTPEGFVAHAVQAADSQIDFGRFDNDGPDGIPNSGDDDGYVDALIVVHPGGDAAGGDSRNFWSHTSTLGPNAVETADPSAGGGFIQVDLYSLLPELSDGGGTTVPAEIGVYCHEFGHQLGLPDLYGTAADSAGGNSAVASNGIGVWCLMALGAYGGDSKSPARPTHLCAWSKLRLSWVSAVGETAGGSFALDPVGTGRQVVRLWDNADRAPGYFLLSYRTKQGFDSSLPGQGLLIWHVDESVFDNNDPRHKLVELKQADGRDDLDQAVNAGDDGDPYPGAANNTSFTGATNPSSNLYDGSPSGVEVSGIRLEQGRAVFSLKQPARERLTVYYDEDGPRQSGGFGFGNNLAHGAVLFTAPVAGSLEAVSTFFLYDSLDYTIELYSGADSGKMRCPVTRQGGSLQERGWRTLPLETPVYLEAGDTIVAVIGYTSKGYDDESPVPYDATGRPEGRSYVSFAGLGRFEPFDHDISIRAVIRPGNQAQTGGINLGPGLETAAGALDFGRTFTGEVYTLPLPLYNPGYRKLALKALETAGSGFTILPVQPWIGCGETLEALLRFDPLVPGPAAGQLIVRPLAVDPPALSAQLNAEVEGWSVRYDSSEVPAAYDVFTESAHGAVEFRLPEGGLLTGVRTYLPRDSMRLELTVWAEKIGGGGHCRIAGSESDTLIEKAGWHQIFLPRPVRIDSTDSFIADILYATPGRTYSLLVPVDTLRESAFPSYYNLRTDDSWLQSRHPVAIHALFFYPDTYFGPLVHKKASAVLRRTSLEFDSLELGMAAAGGFWLINSGSSALRADISALADDDSVLFTPGRNSLTIGCEDSVYLALSCLARSPGIHTGVLEIRTSDSDRPILRVSLSAEAGRFVLARDEQGHTATAGFNDSLAYGAVVFGAPWSGTLERVRLYLNKPNQRAALAVFRSVGEGPVWTDSAAGLPDTIIPSSGWQDLTLPVPLAFQAGDSFAVLVRLVSADLYPLAIDHRGVPSGQSWAAHAAQGPWEKLSYDLNLRAVLETARAGRFPVAGRTLGSAGQPLGGARLSLVSGERNYRAESDSSGNFSFGAVAEGTYSLSAELEGYRFAGAIVAVQGGAVSSLALTGRRFSAGDLDGSGRVDIFDLISMLQVLAGRTALNGTEDLDGSGRLDIFDLLELLRILSE